MHLIHCYLTKTNKFILSFLATYFISWYRTLSTRSSRNDKNVHTTRTRKRIFPFCNKNIKKYILRHWEQKELSIKLLVAGDNVLFNNILWWEYCRSEKIPRQKTNVKVAIGSKAFSEELIFWDRRGKRRGAQHSNLCTGIVKLKPKGQPSHWFETPTATSTTVFIIWTNQLTLSWKINNDCKRKVGFAVVSSDSVVHHLFFCHRRECWFDKGTSALSLPELWRCVARSFYQHNSSRHVYYSLRVLWVEYMWALR